MKFAETMEKGSRMVEPVAGKLFDGYIGSQPTKACALGMVDLASRSLNQVSFNNWPWTSNLKVALPCGCTGTCMGGGCAPYNYRDGKNEPFFATIVHLFNYHVMTAKDWTMDRLLKWVACVEDHKDHPEELVEQEELVAK